MKKFLSLAILISTLFIANAQVQGPYYFHDARNGTYQTALASPGQKESGRDSVNSGTTVLAPTLSYAYAQADSTILKGSYRAASVMFVLTKVSGTVAGTVRMEGSVDGMTWSSAGADTLTLANNTTNTYTWELPGRPRLSNSTTLTGAYNVRALYTKPDVLPYLYYRCYIAGTGTWCGTFYAAIVPRI